MWGPKKLAIAFSTALVASGVIVLAPVITSPASAVEIVLDGGFEAGTPSAAWTEADSQFGTPLCDVPNCGTGGGAAGPHSGAWWAWFGGFSTAGHTGSLSQAVTIPAGTTVTLTYWYRNGTVSTPFDAQLLVKVDGATVNTHIEASVAEGAYSQKTVDLTAFANGASHTLSFEYTNGGTGTNSMTVDDVSIDAITADDPPTAVDDTKTVAEDSGATTIDVLANDANADGGPKTITLVSQPTNGTVAITNAGADLTYTPNPNYCNGGSPTDNFTYTLNGGSVGDVAVTVTCAADTTPPNTTFTTSPAGGVAKSLTVPFGFASSESGSTFSCALDTTTFTPCTTPKSVTVIPGPHTFKVAATDSATNTDATPATSSFIAYDCKTLDAKVAKAKKKVKKLKKKIKNTTDEDKLAKLKKQLKKAKKQLKKAKKAAKPCHG